MPSLVVFAGRIVQISECFNNPGFRPRCNPASSKPPPRGTVFDTGHPAREENGTGGPNPLSKMRGQALTDCAPGPPNETLKRQTSRGRPVSTACKLVPLAADEPTTRETIPRIRERAPRSLLCTHIKTFARRLTPNCLTLNQLPLKGRSGHGKWPTTCTYGRAWGRFFLSHPSSKLASPGRPVDGRPNLEALPTMGHDRFGPRGSARSPSGSTPLSILNAVNSACDSVGPGFFATPDPRFSAPRRSTVTSADGSLAALADQGASWWSNRNAYICHACVQGFGAAGFERPRRRDTPC